MKYVALLAGEFADIALGEIRAYTKARGSDFEIADKSGRIVVFLANEGIDFSELALTHEVSVFFGHDVHDINAELIGKNVKVCVEKIPGSAKGSKTYVEKETKMWLIENGIKVDSEGKEAVIAYISENNLFFGKRLFAIDRNKIRGRNPEKRPYNFSGTVDAVVSKACVNLAQVTKGEIADPFSGSGAFLIEAGVAGMAVFGCDTSKKHVFGARRNLRHFGVKKFDVRLMDALSICGIGRQFDGVVTDLPWGRNTRSRYEKKDLYRRFMELLPEILKKGSFAVISCDVDNLWCPDGIRAEERFALTLRKSLKRYIHVFRRV